MTVYFPFSCFWSSEGTQHYKCYWRLEKQRINKDSWTSYRLNFTTWLSLKSCVLTTVGSWIQVKRVFTINQESVCCPNFCTIYSLKHIQKCFAEALHWSSFNSVLAPKGTLCLTMTPVKLLLIRSAPAKSHNSTQLPSSTSMPLKYLPVHQMRCCMELLCLSA